MALRPPALSPTISPAVAVTPAMRETPSLSVTRRQHVRFTSSHKVVSQSKSKPLRRSTLFHIQIPLRHCLVPVLAPTDSVSAVPPRVENVDPCSPSPCGSNAVCHTQRGAAACQCIPEYFGDPHVSCRPECVVHSDCPSNKACLRTKCIDPCPGTCGVNADCRVRNHIPTCTCTENYIGDPFTACRLKPSSK